MEPTGTLQVDDVSLTAQGSVLRRLTCSFKTESIDGEMIPDLSNNSSEKVYLTQEPGKKSSFLLETAEESIVSCYTVEKPPNVVIEYENPQASTIKDSTFFLGGFQMVSTAKTVEIYLTDLEGKEAYLTTSKGIAFNKEDKSAPWYKTICVVPGGPRPVSSLRIKLLSLKPTDATTAKLQFMKITARIAETPSPQTQSAQRTASSPSSNGSIPTSVFGDSPSKTKSVFFATPEPVKPEPTRPKVPAMVPTAAGSSGVTQSDLGAAMAGVSFMTRSTEKGIEEALNNHTKRLEKSFGTCFLRLEQQLHFLQRHLIVQQQLIQENSEVMELQQKAIEEQTVQLRSLSKQNDDLKIRVQSLQADMSIVRYHRLDPSCSIQGRKRGVLEPSESISEMHDPPMMSSDPPIIEIGTKMRDIDIDEAAEDVVSGIVDHSMEATREVGSVQLENMNLKNLIRQTAREIEERPVTCGPSLPQKPLACGSLPSFGEDQVLFRGMMLTDEELKYKRMSELRACKETDDTSPQEAEVAPSLSLGDANEVEEEPDEDVHVNIEVTLMDDADGEEVGNEGDSDYRDEDEGNSGFDNREPHSSPSVDELLAEPDDEDHQDHNMSGGSSKWSIGLRSIDEKKEMEPLDTEDVVNLVLKSHTTLDATPETKSCFDCEPQNFSCVSRPTS